MNDEDETFYWQELDDACAADLLPIVAATLAPSFHRSPALYGIVSPIDGGIIAYALGADHANEIISALNEQQDRYR